MEAPQLETRDYTVEEYLELLEQSEHKIEFLDGRLRMMAGGTVAHGTIVDNIFLALATGKHGCSVKSSEHAVSVATLNRYLFPDVSAVCEGLAEYEATGIARLTNPNLIVEVTSKSTGEYDRGEKFHAYRQLPSFQEYVLIDSRKYSVDTYHREDESLWHIRTYFELAIRRVPNAWNRSANAGALRGG